MRKKCIYSWFGYPMKLEERFEMIKESGFDGVMLWWEDKHIEGGDVITIYQPDIARRYGLYIENMHMPYYKMADLIWKDGIDGEDYTRYVQDVIHKSKQIGVETIVLHTAETSDIKLPNTIALERMKRIAEEAERCEVKLALENILFNDTLDYLMQVKSPYLGFCFDSGHNNCMSQDSCMLDKYGDRLFTVHFHDNDGKKDEHRIPYDGSIDWNGIMHKLNKLEYNGAVGLEVVRGRSNEYNILTPKDFLNRASRAAQMLIDTR